MAAGGRDGARAEELLREAQKAGAKAIAEACKSAVKRLLDNPARAAGMRNLFMPQERDKLVKALEDTSATANLLGRARVRARVKKAFGEEGAWIEFADADLKPMPPQDALAYFKSKVPTISAGKNFTQAQHQRAFTLAGVTEKSLLKKVQATIADALATGETTGSAALKVQKVLDAAGVSSRNPARAEMIVRTNLMSSLNEGQTQEMQSADLRDVFPVWRYDGIKDGRQGADHEPHFGLYYPNAVPFPQVRGPRAFNCRCVPTPVDAGTWDDLQAAGTTIAPGYERYMKARPRPTPKPEPVAPVVEPPVVEPVAPAPEPVQPQAAQPLTSVIQAWQMANSPDPDPAEIRTMLAPLGSATLEELNLTAEWMGLARGKSAAAVRRAIKNAIDNALIRAPVRPVEPVAPVVEPPPPQPVEPVPEPRPEPSLRDKAAAISPGVRRGTLAFDDPDKPLTDRLGQLVKLDTDIVDHAFEAGLLKGIPRNNEYLRNLNNDYRTYEQGPKGSQRARENLESTVNAVERDAAEAVARMRAAAARGEVVLDRNGRPVDLAAAADVYEAYVARAVAEVRGQTGLTPPAEDERLMAPAAKGTGPKARAAEAAKLKADAAAAAVKGTATGLRGAAALAKKLGKAVEKAEATVEKAQEKLDAAKEKAKLAKTPAVKKKAAAAVEAAKAKADEAAAAVKDATKAAKKAAADEAKATKAKAKADADAVAAKVALAAAKKAATDEVKAAKVKPLPKPKPKPDVPVVVPQINVKEIDDVTLDRMKLDYSKIPADQRAAVKEAVDDYALGSGYELLNGYLRGTPGHTAADLGKYTKLLDKMAADLRTAIDKGGHVLEQDVKVYRGVGKMPKTLKVGDTFEDKGFVSSTSDKGFAGEFAKKALYEIRVPAGEKVLVPIGSSNRKKELVLKDGTTFRVVGKVGNVIQLEVVPSVVPPVEPPPVVVPPPAPVPAPAPTPPSPVPAPVAPAAPKVLPHPELDPARAPYQPPRRGGLLGVVSRTPDPVKPPAVRAELADLRTRYVAMTPEQRAGVAQYLGVPEQPGGGAPDPAVFAGSLSARLAKNQGVPNLADQLAAAPHDDVCRELAAQAKDLEAKKVRSSSTWAAAGRSVVKTTLSPADPSPVEIKVHKKATPKYRKAIEETRAFFDGLIDKGQSGAVAPVKTGETDDGRAYYEKGMIAGHEELPTKTLVHEYGHHLENTYPGVKEAAYEFMAMRVGNEKPVKLKDVVSPKYEDDEMGRKDDFTKAFDDEESAYYAGKVYKDGSTEIVSMGVELMYKDPVGFAKRDPQYFNFIAGILSGKARSQLR